MAMEDRFGEFATETRALQRGLTWLQQHDRNTPSQQAAEEALGIAPPTKDERELQASQHHVPLSETEQAVDRLIAQLEAKQAAGNKPAATTGLSDIAEDDQLQEIEAAERRAAYRQRRNSPVDSRRIRRRTEMVNGQIDISKHQRRCLVCKHPDREAIEEGFLQWRRTGDLRLEFDLPNRTCIRRHATAFGLFEKRARNMRFALDAIIEEAENVRPTADAIIRAIRAYGCLDEHGRWIEPPRRVIFSRESLPAAPETAALPSPAVKEIEVQAREIKEAGSAATR
jgi:hypothetical protein